MSLSNLKAQWVKKRAALPPKDKNFPMKTVQILVDMMGQLQLAERLQLFQRVVAPGNREDEFQDVLVQAHVVLLTDKRNSDWNEDQRRERLILLLSRHYPRIVGMAQTELYLAIRDVQDAVLVLTASYQRSTQQVSRAALLQALRSAFNGLSVQAESEETFVQECARYWIQHKKTLRLNMDYGHRALFAEGQGLFVLQPKGTRGLERKE